MPTSPSHTPSEPLISFVIPCYKVPANWLTACLQSILALPLPASQREIIVIDDGNPEPLDPIVAPFGKLVRCVCQKNSGLGEARNAGIAQAHGTYIQFVDADDYLLPQAYRHCLQALQTAAPDIVCFQLIRQVDTYQANRTAQHAPDFWQKTPYEHYSIFTGTEYMRHHNLRASACGYLFRRSILHGLRFPKGLLHEDEDFTPRLFLNANRVCDLPIQAYYYRLNPHSITGSQQLLQVKKRLDSKLEIISRLHNLSTTLPAQKQDALERRIAQLTMDLLLDMAGSPLSRSEFDKRIDVLSAHASYPLPARPYCITYLIFALLMRRKACLHLLRCLLQKH